MTPSDLLKAWTKHCEGCTLTAYWDRSGYSIGYGYHGPDVIEGMVWTQEEADDHLLTRIQEAAASVNQLVKVPLTQGQFDALVDFVYNEGAGSFSGSTLLRQLRAGLYDSARQSFYWVDDQNQPHGWIYVRNQDGELVVSEDLIGRRKGDQILWDGGNPLESA